MALWGKTEGVGDAPKFTTNATTGDKGSDNFGTELFGVDVVEAQVVGKGVTPGWVLKKDGTGGRAGRTQYETLVAMKEVTTDAEDVAFPDV